MGSEWGEGGGVGLQPGEDWLGDVQLIHFKVISFEFDTISIFLHNSKKSLYNNFSPFKSITLMPQPVASFCTFPL